MTEGGGSERVQYKAVHTIQHNTPQWNGSYMAAFFHSGASAVTLDTDVYETDEYQEFPKTEAQEAVTNRTPKSRAPEVSADTEYEIEIDEYQEFPKTEAQEVVTTRTPKSGASEVTVEPHEYQEFPDTAAQVAVTNKTPSSKSRRLGVVLVSVGLLCVLQAVLNISLRIFLCPADPPVTLFLSNQTLPGDPVPSDPVPTEGEGGKPSKPVPSDPVPTDGGREKKHCPENWLMFSNHCYFISVATRNWDQSRRACRDQGADLVIINNRREQEFLMTLSPAAWVGMTDRKVEGTWRWVDGTLVPRDSLSWARGQPDDTYVGEDCGDLRAMKDFNGLNDYLCTALNLWICEKPALMLIT